MPFLSQNQAKALLLDYLYDNTPTGFEPEDTKFPNSEGSNEPNRPFIEIRFEFFRSTPVTASLNALHRTPGVIEYLVHIPKGNGDKLAGQAQDHVLTLVKNNLTFRNMGFHFQGYEVEPLENLIGSGHYTESLNIFFYIEGT